MSLQLISRKNVLYHKGIPTLFAQTGRKFPVLTAHIQSFTPVAYFRTTGFGDEGPYKASQLRQSSTSLNVPTTLEDISKEEIPATISLEIRKQDVAKRLKKETKIRQSLTLMTKVYDFVTLPIYAAIQQPWKKMALNTSVKAKTVDAEKVTYTSVVPKSAFHAQLDQLGVDTMAAIFNRAVKTHSDKLCLGVRTIISEEEVRDKTTGKMMKKFELGNYTWKTYKEVEILVNHLIKGINQLKLRPQEKIAIFAETREEWFLTAMVAFKQNLPIVTVFTTLTDEGVIHALKETEVRTLITSEDLMHRCKDVLKDLPNVQNVVYFDKQMDLLWTPNDKLPNNAQVYKYSQLISEGAAAPESTKSADSIAPPKPSDLAIIMYTSGSTGVPKGVMLSHKNMVSGLKSCMDVTDLMGGPKPNDVYAGYLPLAHAMEIMCETMSFIQGVRIGYCSPLTLTDKSLGVKEGSKGDATILKPTVLPAVPLVIERICKGIQEKVAEAGHVPEVLFNYFVQYKMGWKRLGYDTPLVDRIFFSKIKALTGGSLRYMVVGSAPLAPETQEFARTVLCCPLAIGYGLTETSAICTMTLDYDISIGRAGGPVSCNYTKLVNWEEGGYRVTDKPYPRGEVYVGGDTVALGYYKKESTDFFEENGVKWFRSGDIAEIHADGVLRIIDRKKDLVKLQNGEFVSLGKVESSLKTTPSVENICAYADASKTYIVAVIVPSRSYVEKLAKSYGRPIEKFDLLCEDPVIIKVILEEIQAQAIQLNLLKTEVPRKIYLCPDPWMPQSGLVTAAFKIKRNNVYKHFENEIAEMYNSV